MFTGIVQETGTIDQIDPLDGGKRVWVSAATDYLANLKPGDSIAINGACCTAVDCLEGRISVDLLAETLDKTTFDQVAIGDIVNLEQALTLSTPLGGHIVTGHIDATTTLKKWERHAEFGELEVSIPSECQKYLIPKGSIAIHGVSLTIVTITDNSLTCHLIPSTISETNLSSLVVGDQVNIEYDMLGKYLYRFYSLEPNRSTHD